MYSNQTAIYLLVLLAAIACIRLLVSRDSRGAAKGDLARFVQAHRGPRVRTATAALIWLASLALTAEVIIRIGAEAPAALPPLRTLGASIAMTAAIAAVLVWTFAARYTPFESPAPGLDRRLSDAAKRLGVSTGEAAMRAIDAGLPSLKPEGD